MRARLTSWLTSRNVSCTLYDGDAVIKTYTGLQFGDAPVGHKQFEGDERTPEGRYSIDTRNPNSAYHLSLRVSYPNAHDRAYAAARGAIARRRHLPARPAKRHSLREGCRGTGPTAASHFPTRNRRIVERRRRRHPDRNTALTLIPLCSTSVRKPERSRGMGQADFYYESGDAGTATLADTVRDAAMDPAGVPLRSRSSPTAPICARQCGTMSRRRVSGRARSGIWPTCSAAKHVRSARLFCSTVRRWTARPSPH